MSATAPQYWRAHTREVFDRLHLHATHCLHCRRHELVTMGGPIEVLISNHCEDGILLLTEWFTAKLHAEREAFVECTGELFPEAPR